MNENEIQHISAGKIVQFFCIVLAILTTCYAVQQYCVVKKFKNPIGFALARNALNVIEKKDNSLLRFSFSSAGDLVLKSLSRIEQDDAEYYYMVRGLYPGHHGFVVRSFIYNLATKAFAGYRFREYGPEGSVPRDIFTIYLKNPASYPEINYAHDSKGNHYFVNNCIGQKNIWKIAAGDMAVMSEGVLPVNVRAMGDENDALSNWSAIHVGPHGGIYISSSVTGRICKYSAEGRRLREIGTVGFSEGELLAPDELFFLSLKENQEPLLTVASTGNRTWVQFNRQGKAVNTISPLKSDYPFSDILVGQMYRRKTPAAVYSFDLVNKSLIHFGEKLTATATYKTKQPAKAVLLLCLALVLLFVVPLFRRIAPHLPHLLFPFYLKFLIFFIPLIIASTYVVGYSVKNIMKDDLEAESVRRSANLARAVINSISLADLENIQRPEDRNSPAYDRIYNTVSRLLDSKSVEYTPKWIIHKIKDGRYYFGISIWKGAIYEPFIVPEDRRVCFRVLADKTPQYGRFVDEQGEWFSHFTPILNSAGNVIYVLELYRPTEALDRTEKEVEQRILKAVAVIILTAVLLLVLLFSYVFTRPLQKFMQSTRIVRTGNFDHKIDVRSRDELGALGYAFNEMIVDLKKYTSDLEKTTAAKERIESELKVARDIQMGFLPKEFPPYPDRCEFDIFATLEPAREVGGDLYDFFFTDEELLCLAIGDVSDKGVPASLFMAVTRTLIRSKAGRELTPEIVLSRVNENLSRENPFLMFVTLFFGTLNIRTGELIYCNGGHNPPLIIRADGEVQVVEMTGGLALGVEENFIYTSKTVTLYRGDTVFLFTDGVTEADNQKRELFSDQRLLKILSSMKGLPVEAIIETVMNEIRSFTKGMPQADDITMMVLRYNGYGPDKPEQTPKSPDSKS